MSRTMVTSCGGDPTVRETVRVTLWWKESLFGGFDRGLPDEIRFVLRGRMRIFFVEERQRFDWRNIERNVIKRIKG